MILSYKSSEQITGGYQSHSLIISISICLQRELLCKDIILYVMYKITKILLKYQREHKVLDVTFVFLIFMTKPYIYKYLRAVSQLICLYDEIV